LVIRPSFHTDNIIDITVDTQSLLIFPEGLINSSEDIVS